MQLFSIALQDLLLFVLLLDFISVYSILDWKINQIQYKYITISRADSSLRPSTCWQNLDNSCVSLLKGLLHIESTSCTKYRKAMFQSRSRKTPKGFLRRETRKATQNETRIAQNKFNHDDISINPSYFFVPPRFSVASSSFAFFSLSGSLPWWLSLPFSVLRNPCTSISTTDVTHP